VTSSVDWPPWSIDGDPGALARYVVPDEVARLARIPGPARGSRLGRLRAVWQALRDAGATYAGERHGSGPAGQWIRAPGEVLAAPGNGTCLDLALVLAGACEHAGLPSAVIVVDPPETGTARHAVVAVVIGDRWPDGIGPGAVWAQRPQALAEQLGEQWGGDLSTAGDVVAVDPNGLARAAGSAPAAGLDASLEEAAQAGWWYLAGGRWTWVLGVPAGWRDDAYRPAPVPAVRPLREIYRAPDTAESTLRLLRAEYQLTPFQSRDELTVLHDFCERVAAGDRTGIAVVHGAGGAGKTRLALELAERLRADGWYAGPLRERIAEADAASRTWLAEVRAPLLVVVDYADARTEETISLLQVLAGRAGPPAVVLLASRSVEGDWLTAVLGGQITDAHAHALDVLELPDTHPRPGDIYRRTFHAIADGQPPALPSDGSVLWTTLDLVLLGWLAAHGARKLPTTPAALYDEVLEHEQRYWAKAYQDLTGRRRGHRGVLAPAAAVLSLLSPQRAEAASALRAVEPLAEDARWRQDVAETLATCLDPGTGQGLAVRPDPVGDHHLLNQLAGTPEL
jgi:hypothetical protein